MHGRTPLAPQLSALACKGLLQRDAHFPGHLYDLMPSLFQKSAVDRIREGSLHVLAPALDQFLIAQPKGMLQIQGVSVLPKVLRIKWSCVSWELCKGDHQDRNHKKRSFTHNTPFDSLAILMPIDFAVDKRF